MIRFCCEHCAHKISVQDEHVGKRCKCSKCGSVIVVPAETTVIEFRCENCDKKISVLKINAGKKAICPKCSNTFIIPTAQFQGPAAPLSYSGDLIARSTDSPHGLTLIDVPEEYKLKEEPACESIISEEAVDRHQETEEDSKAEEPKAPAQKRREDVVDGLSLEERQLLDGEIRVDDDEQAGERKLPWLVDIFLYPTTTSGMIHIAFFVIVPILIGLLNRFVLLYASYYGTIVSAILYIFLIGYMFYYFVECVRDSAAGGLRAPEIFGSTFGKDKMLEQYFTLFACYAFFFGPITFYRSYIYFYHTQMNNAIFWSLFAYGIFLFPMGILAVVMFDSINGLNPILLICSIASTFFQYWALILFICVLGFLPVALKWILPQSLIISFISSAVRIYLIMVIAHLLGRFYWRYQDKLNWEV